MGDKSKLTTDFLSKEIGYVTFGDKNKGRIMGEGNIGDQYKTINISTSIHYYKYDIISWLNLVFYDGSKPS